ARVVQRGIVEAADGEGVEALARGLPRRADDAARRHRLIGAELDMAEPALAFRKGSDMHLRLRQLVLARHVGEHLVMRSLARDGAEIHDLQRFLAHRYLLIAFALIP